MPDHSFIQYRRKQIAELRPYVEGEDVSHVSISPEDVKAGSPKSGDMIARNPKNHADQWLVARAYFLDNFEALTAAEQAEPSNTDGEERRWQRATAVQSRKLQMVLDIPGVKERLQEVTGNPDGYMLAGIEQAEPAPAIDAPLGAIENGRVFLQRLEQNYDFQCEAGGLAYCSDYHEAVRCFEAMAEWIYHHAPAATCKHPVWGQDNDGTRVCAKCGLVEHPAARSGAVKVKALMRDFEDFINQPPQYEDQRMVRDYRHELYRKWEPLCRLILAALEPAEPASDAEREFNEVLNEAEAFNDALPERMRKNARDWLRPDDEPTTDAKPVRQWPQFIYDSEGEPSTRPPESRLRGALEWYAEQARLCRLIHSGGDAGRNALAKDGGAKARAALAQEDGRNE